MLYVEDENGCSDFDKLTIGVISKPIIHIPNIFTPNGDNINDNFTITTGSGISEILTIEIFDRWGNKVFIKENVPLPGTDVSWNGTYNGSSLMSGVYVYHIHVMTSNGVSHHISGDLTLIR